jgi:hypothetical protein
MIWGKIAEFEGDRSRDRYFQVATGAGFIQLLSKYEEI